jgi:hypothetical protein
LHHWEKARGDWPALHKRVLAFKFIPRGRFSHYSVINYIRCCFMSNVVYFIDSTYWHILPLHQASQSVTPLMAFRGCRDTDYPKVFRGFHGSSTAVILYWKDTDPLLPHHFQRIVNHLTSWCYTVRGTDIQPII